MTANVVLELRGKANETFIQCGKDRVKEGSPPSGGINPLLSLV